MKEEQHINDDEKKVVIIGTLDTKGEEHLFLKQKIEEKGLKTIVINTGIIDAPYFHPDISSREVCNAAGRSIAKLIKKGDRRSAIEHMALGASKVVSQLYEMQNLDAIISLGGSQGTYISTTAMRALPFGVPKIMVSTAISGDVSGYVGYKDITLIHSIADILGLNAFSKNLYSQAASAICGMIQEAPSQKKREKPLVGVTMFGVTTPCSMKIKRLFERQNNTHDLIFFHARGTGGRAMEELIRRGFIKGVIDITITELADELVGGIRSAGPNRLEAAGEMGIPQIVCPGALDMVNFGPINSIPGKFSERTFYFHNPMVTGMRTNIEENRKLGFIVAAKLNKAKGSTLVIIPNKGFSALDDVGGIFFDPDCDRVFTQSLKEHLNPRIKFLEIDCHINDDEFAQVVVDQFLQIM